MATPSTSRRTSPSLGSAELDLEAARERRELIARIEAARTRRYAWLRKQILENGRIDLLASEVLGLQVRPHHLKFLQHMVKNRCKAGRLSMILAYRGAGKSIGGSIPYIIDAILRNPDIKILLVSKSSTKAMEILSVIRKHLESNEKFQAIFGTLQGDKWDETCINVSTRTKISREPTVSVTGIESAVTGGHFDLIVVDDLIDKEYARTPAQRQKAFTFFYETLLPCLEKPDGQMIIIGTRYHFRDLYGHLLEHECRHTTLTVPVITGNDVDGWTSAWEEKYSVEDMLELRTSMGPLLFDGQYLCDCRKMQGKIFDYDHMIEVPDNEIPQNLPRYGGADLAISMNEKRDSFAVVDIAYDHATDMVYVLDFETGHYPPVKQRATVKAHAKRHESIKYGIESNAYQAAAADDIKIEDPTVNVIKIFTTKDKITRAWELTGRFESGKIVFRQGLAHLIEQVVMFPDGDHDDGFDALDISIRTIKARERKPREEFGLL